jgi:hypothetical protein
MTGRIFLGILGLAVIAIGIMVAPDIKRYVKISTMLPPATRQGRRNGKGIGGMAVFLAGLLLMNTVMTASACGLFRGVAPYPEPRGPSSA